METTLPNAGGKLHFVLAVALLAACSVNLLLLCTWLQGT